MTGMKLTFVNVGYGEAVLVEVPDARRRNGRFTMLIDAGSRDAAEFTSSHSGRIPAAAYLQRAGVDQIDVLVNTHIHEDHTGGIPEIVGCCRVGEFWQTLPERIYRQLPALDPGVAERVTGRKYIQSINDYKWVCDLLRNRVRELPEPGCSEEPADGLRVTVLGPDRNKKEALNRFFEEIISASEDTREKLRDACCRADAGMNNLSAILLLEYAGRRILLPGDTNRDGYEGITGLKADIFKVGHHGQQDGISRELFRKIHPDYVVCCASSDRRYESAAPEVLKMMREEGAELLFSDCPPVPRPMQQIPPHNALVFEISEEGEISARYENCREALRRNAM